MKNNQNQFHKSLSILFLASSSFYMYLNLLCSIIHIMPFPLYYVYIFMTWFPLASETPLFRKNRSEEQGYISSKQNRFFYMSHIVIYT